MVVLNVPDMHCSGCVDRITKALTGEHFFFEVSLADKTVSIEGEEEDVERAKELLDDLGFEATED